MTRQARRDWLTVMKDLILFGTGVGLIIQQGWFVPKGDFNLFLLIFGGVMANIPGVTSAWALRTALALSPDRPGASASSSPSSSGMPADETMPS